MTQQEDPYSAASRAVCELATEQCLGHASSITKQMIFNLTNLEQEREARRQKLAEKAAEGPR